MLPEGVDRREAIPTGPKASHGYTYLPPMIRATSCSSEMLQWPLALWLAWLCVTFLRTSEIMFLYLKLASGDNKLLSLTFGNSKYLLRAEMKNQGNWTNVGQEEATALTGIVQSRAKVSGTTRYFRTASS